MRLVLSLLFLFLAPVFSSAEGDASGPPSPAASEKAAPAYGILILAHGGDPRWNREVTALRDALNAKVPTEVTFGMAYGAQVREIQETVTKLERRDIKKVVAVPLFVNSESEVMDQVRFVLGLAKAPSQTLADRMKAIGGHDHGNYHSYSEPGQGFDSHFDSSGEKRVKTTLPLVLTPALDADPLVVEILVDRAKALSKDPAKETLILVGHGPVEETKNKAWLETMDSLGEAVRKKAGFKAAKSTTLRDDATSDVRDKAAKSLRDAVAQASRDGGRAVVVPHLIAQGGIEAHIVRALEGLQYAWDGKTLMPHKNFTDWALKRAAAGAKKDDMRMFK